MTVSKLNRLLTKEEIFELQQLMLSWFQEHQRVFPWRKTKKPYQILIAEKLLQQTSAGERVVTAYLAITGKFPDFQSLSDAKLADVSELIIPLGLHYRAEELIHLANVIQERYQGELPKDYKMLLGLPGIGEYTARAVMSFVYNENMAIVDINVARFLYRVFGINVPVPANPARNRFLIDLATMILPDGISRDFNLAILDLCSAVCKSRNPVCVRCPINKICFTGRHVI